MIDSNLSHPFTIYINNDLLNNEVHTKHSMHQSDFRVFFFKYLQHKNNTVYENNKNRKITRYLRITIVSQYFVKQLNIHSSNSIPPVFFLNLNEILHKPGNH